MSKEKEATTMSDELIKASREYTMEELHNAYQKDWKYRNERHSADSGRFEMWLGDSVELMKEMADESVDLSVYSPPFSDMYVYNNSPRDLSNCLDMDEFMRHYAYIIRENLRVTKPGRLCCVHIQDPKAFINKDNYRGIKDLSGDVVKAYINEGWIYRACISIDKNPQIVATRNKDSDLLFVTGKRDSTGLAPCVPDYLLLFRKPGDNKVPVTPYANGEMSESEWIEWAHPIWYNISETDVLNVAVARGNDDEKHMCPLQLPLIDRCIRLWSNPNELVFSPFAGIGSEIYQAVLRKRKGLGIELKPEYWQVAIRNCENAEKMTGQTLFDYAGIKL